MDLLNSKNSTQAYERFMNLLEHDERLMDIIEKNNVNVDNILYLPTDNGRDHKIIAITKKFSKTSIQ